MTIGARNTLIQIMRAGPPIDDGLTRRPGPLIVFTKAMAEVLFGTGQERRTAAQEAASQTATFKIDWTPKAATIAPSDQIDALGSSWDISSAVPIGRNREVHITATRRAK
jgi:hypothetical protein